MNVMRVNPLGVLAVAAVLTAALFVACGGGDEEVPGLQPTVEVPPGVPQAASPAPGSFELGHIERAFGPDPDVSRARTLEDMACVDDLLTIRTDREIVYAQMPCDRFLAPEQVAALEGQPAAIRVDARQGQRLVIESTAGSAEFTVTEVWVEER